MLHHHLFPSNMDASELHFIYIDFYQNVAKMMFQGKRGSRMKKNYGFIVQNLQCTAYNLQTAQQSTAHQSTQEQEQEQEQTETVEQPNTAKQTTTKQTTKQIQSNCKI